MRFIEFLTEMLEPMGAVVSTSRDGKFYDINFVNYETQEPITGYAKNLANHFVRQFKEGEGNWEHLPRFFANRFDRKPLGPEYSDEDARFNLFGPFTERQLSGLWDEYADEYGL